MDKSLVEKTKKVIESISTLEVIKPYILVGGTALSLQIEHRLSEDLDFMRWQKTKGEKMEVDGVGIAKELKKKGHQVNSIDILDSNQILFFIDEGIKISFYAAEKREPVIQTVLYMNNLRLADDNTIAALKMETMMRRNTFRDYYDLYFILKEKSSEEIVSIINNALKYSGHQLKSVALIGKLSNYERFSPDIEFKNLSPKSAITAKEIAAFMTETVKTAYQNRYNKNNDV
ncbi:MAG: nucleotidyl transferase AbiEii/AbiGii toxin family protein [Dysgonamonadaceae bacterium]|jgi:predicted nucleotidyltransferase component of viral defense system|nr:nucleotidyl transferase AbiEii/AbiGii toxin family protein [Dysgonamonadaceae bacterium]